MCLTMAPNRLTAQIYSKNHNSFGPYLVHLTCAVLFFLNAGAKQHLWHPKHDFEGTWGAEQGNLHPKGKQWDIHYPKEGRDWRELENIHYLWD